LQWAISRKQRNPCRGTPVDVMMPGRTCVCRMCGQCAAASSGPQLCLASKMIPQASVIIVPPLNIGDPYISGAFASACRHCARTGVGATPHHNNSASVASTLSPNLLRCFCRCAHHKPIDRLLPVLSGMCQLAGAWHLHGCHSQAAPPGCSIKYGEGVRVVRDLLEGKRLGRGRTFEGNGGV
jgi:hypothetical protein